MVFKELEFKVSSKLPRLNSPKSISPSHYFEDKQCALCFVLRGNCNLSRVPPNASAILGTTIHEFLAWAGSSYREGVTESQAKDKFDSMITELDNNLKASSTYSKFYPIEKSEHRFGEKRHDVINRAIRPASNFKFIGRKSTVRSMIEKTVTSSDGLIVGSMDYLYFKDNQIIIRDFKSEIFRDGTSIKPAYKEQLFLYAGLIFDALGRYPDHIILVDRVGHEISIPFSDTFIKANFESAKRWITALKTFIDSVSSTEEYELLANPSIESCKYCVCRPSCPVYWKFRSRNTAALQFDVQLTVDEIKNFKNAFLIICKYPNQAVTVRLPLSLADDFSIVEKLKRGDSIRIINSHKLGNQYVLNPESSIFLLD